MNSSPSQELDLVDRLIAEYADRIARDEAPRREELLARAPQFREELERCFDTLDAASSKPGAGEFAPGRELGDFTLLRELGRGGMAVVYEAEQRSLRRRVALKLLRNHLTLDAKQLERFQREARAAARIRHDNVVPIHAVGEHGGHAFIAFELMSGPSLEQVIARLARAGRRPSAAEFASAVGAPQLSRERDYSSACMRWFLGVLEGVGAAHAAGLIHRDLKPSNVLIDGDGRPRVSDFGLAKDLGEASLSITGETLGTPHYMSPEQASAAREPIDVRTDIYSLGVTLYELIALRRPFDGATFAELLQSISHARPPLLRERAPDAPASLESVLAKCLAKERDQRYANVAELARELQRVLDGAPVEAPSASGWVAVYEAAAVAWHYRRPFEFRSRARVFGLPLLHILLNTKTADGRGHKPAVGVLAIGNRAFGFYAFGFVAVGVSAVGALAVGPFGAGLVALGLIAFGALAAGDLALGLWVAGRRGNGFFEAWVAERIALDAATTAPGELAARGFATLYGSCTSSALLFILFGWVARRRAIRRQGPITAADLLVFVVGPLLSFAPVLSSQMGWKPPYVLTILYLTVVSWLVMQTYIKLIGGVRNAGAA